MRKRIMVWLIFGLLAAGNATAQQTSTGAQERPFVFSVSAMPSETPHVSVHVESGFGERAFDATDANGPEQRFGVQAYLGRRLTFVGSVGIAAHAEDARSTQQGELLYALIQNSRAKSSVAVGVGARHEPLGANVLLARVIAGRSFSGWRLDGNALFERPMGPLAEPRDGVDVITSAGVSRRLHPAIYAGLEFIGEDLEGFWETSEAEGGARLLLGPSIRIAPRAQRWQLSVAGGPVIHATRSARSSEAIRSLPSSGGRSGYAVRLSLNLGL